MTNVIYRTILTLDIVDFTIFLKHRLLAAKTPEVKIPTLCQISVYMHLIALGLLRFVEYMSAVYVDEEFGDLFQPEDTYEYWRRQVSSAATSGANPGA